MNILVVDDDVAILTLASEILRQAGHRVITTTDARRAIKIIDCGDIDLLMSDVDMPVMTGPELVVAVRRRRSELPVLLMSGSTRIDGCPFLAKPFRTQDVLNALHWALAFSALNAHPGRRLVDRLPSPNTARTVRH